jgi:hypothetical protein
VVSTQGKTGRRGAGWSAAALVAVALAGAGLAQTGTGHSVLRHAGLFQPPASYTALSFADPGQFPQQLYSRKALLDASFVIRNVTAAGHSYHWQIVDWHRGQERRLASGQTAVDSGGQATVARQVLTSCVGARLELVVRLTAPRESVTYWTTCWPGRNAG